MSKQNLFAGVSALALGAALFSLSSTADAASCAGTISTSVSGTYTLTSGNCSISGSGIITSTVGAPGVTISGSAGTLSNSGAIVGGTGLGGYGVNETGQLGALINSGSISGNFAVYENGTIGLVNNSGVITGIIGYGFENAGTITQFTNSGTITATGANETALYNYNGHISTLTNSGKISALGAGITQSGTITVLDNVHGGTIYGGSTGIKNGGTIGALTNSGSIGGGNAGIYNYNSSGGVALIGSLINNSGATISSLVNATSGTIGSAGAAAGLTNSGVIGLVNNTFGTILGTIGIDNGGTIGTLSNANGTILGATGIKNGGTIGAITNTGGIISNILNTRRIGTGATGIANADGTIGGIINSGLITGSAYAINTSGVLGPITNDGTIAGTILNDSFNTMTINGSGSGFGTLTGYGGAAGSIISEGADLHIDTGHLVLNDNIDMSDHTLLVSDATISVVGQRAITATYHQTGGGLIFNATSDTDYSYMSISGSAAISGTNVTIAGANLTRGESFTIVRPTGMGTYTDNTVSVAESSGLTAILTSTGTNGTAGNDLLVTLATNNTAYTNLVQSYAEPTFQAMNAVDLAGIGAVEQHQETEMPYNPDGTGAAAGSDTRESAIWGQMLDGAIMRDSQSDSPGYNMNDYGIMVGADHRFNPNVMGGVALSWIRAWSTGTGAGTGSSSELNSYQITFYGTYRLDRFFIDGQAGAGYNHYQQTAVAPLVPMNASYGGEQGFGKATVGYDFPVNGVTLTPFGGLRWVHANNDSYTATGGGGTRLFVDSVSLDAVSHDIGGKVSWSMPIGSGSLKTDLKAAWVHDYVQGAITTTGSINGDTPFSTTSSRTDPDGAQIDLAATYNTAGNVSIRAEYSGELRDGFQSHTGFLKLLWGF